MIISFTGTPGSGKTYDAVRKILDNLKSGGRVVYTNIRGIDDDICREAIKNFCGLSDSQLNARLKIIPDDKVSTFFDFVERGSLVVLDEVQNYFGSRDWNSDKNKAFGKWASTHRHYGFDVILITQHIDRLDVSVRALVEWLYVYRKINFFGAAVKNKYVCYSWLGSEDHGKPLNKNIKNYEKKIFLCYQSYVAKDIKETGVMAHANVLRHPVFYILPLIILVTAYMFFKKSSFKDGDLFGSGKSIKAAEEMKKKNISKLSPPVALPSVPSGSFPVSGGHALESAGVPPERMPVPDLKSDAAVPDHSLASLMGEDDYFVDSLGFVDFGGSCAAWVVSDGVRYSMSDIFDRADIDCSNARVLSLRLEDGRSLRFFSRGVRRG